MNRKKLFTGTVPVVINYPTEMVLSLLWDCTNSENRFQVVSIKTSNNQWGLSSEQDTIGIWQNMVK